MRINNNIMALNAHRQLVANQGLMSKSMERLSSGLRINRAGDDAAGLAISEKMRAQMRGLKQASRNAQDGISLIQTAEGALNETHSILQRMRELAVQAASDTLTNEDRGKIQDEMNQLRQEIDRIAANTEFNTKKLLDGSISKTVTDSGTNAASFDDSGYRTTASTQAGVYTVTFTSAATQGTLGDQATATTNATGFTDTTSVQYGANTSILVNGVEITISATDTLDDIATKINNVSSQTGVQATAFSNGTNGGITLTTVKYGSDATVQVSGANVDLKKLALTTGTDTVISDAGTDAVATLTGSGSYTMTEAVGNRVTFSNGLTVVGIDGIVADGHTATVTVSTGNTLDFQIGANENQNLNLAINDMSANALGIAGASSTEAISVASYADAKAAITALDTAISTVSNERAKLGAVQNRLEHTISNLGTSAENLQAAESRIRDVDMAAEMMAFTKANILNQAATAMLAQANAAPQSVLQLLG